MEKQYKTRIDATATAPLKKDGTPSWRDTAADPRPHGAREATRLSALRYDRESKNLEALGHQNGGAIGVLHTPRLASFTAPGTSRGAPRSAWRWCHSEGVARRIHRNSTLHGGTRTWIADGATLWHALHLVEKTAAFAHDKQMPREPAESTASGVSVARTRPVWVALVAASFARPCSPSPCLSP